METDAKGQLGGLECSKAERERVAEGSGSWKCGVCAKSNREILAECEEAVKELEQEGKEVKDEVEVPSELKMGKKDDMGKKEESTEDAELAEGFVRTVESANASRTENESYPAARPGQGVPQPTGTRSTTTTAQPIPQQPAPRVTPAPAYPNQQAQLAQRRSNDGVPMWIDRAIAGVVILLVAMVTKILLGL